MDRLGEGKRRRVGGPKHQVQFYEQGSFLVGAVAEFALTGLTLGEGVLLITTPEHRTQIEAALSARGIDLLEVRADGSYIALDAADTLALFMSDGVPDATRFHALVGDVVRALAGRCKRVRAFGEMVALLWAEGESAAACQLEKLWNELLANEPFTLLCGYPIDAFSDARGRPGLKEVCSLHTHVVPAESYSTLQSRSDQGAMIATLQQTALSVDAEVASRQQAEAELRDFVENAVEGLHKVGRDGRILWANRAELEMLGYESSEYIGHLIAEFHVDQDVIADILKRLTAGQELINQPARLRCKNGAIKDVLIHSNGCFKDGKFVYSRCFTRDVTESKRAEQERITLADIVESSDDAIIGASLDGVIRSWNAGAVRLYGYTAAEATGQPIAMIVPPEETANEERIFSRVRDGERIEHYETQRIAKDGRRVDISLTVSPIRDADGRLIGASKIARDITRQKKTEKELLASRSQLTADLKRIEKLHEAGISLLHERDHPELYEKLLDAAVEIMRADFASMQMVDEDRDALRLLGWHGFGPEFGEVFEYCTRDMRTSCATARNRSERVVISNIEKCDFIAGTPALDLHLKMGIRACQSTPLIARSGRMIGMITTHWRTPHEPSAKDLQLLDLLARQAADLLDRIAAERKIQESEKRFRQLVDLLPVGMYACNSSGAISYYNDAAVRLWGRRPELYSKRDLYCGSQRLFLPDGTPLAHNQCPMVAAVHEGKEFRNQEVIFERPDGSRFTALVNIGAMLDDDGRPMGAINVFHDISVIKQAERELREADRKKDEFLATLAHELRNPLAPLRNGLNVMSLAGMNAETSVRVRTMMERQLGHLVRLVDDLLEVARINQGKIDLQKESIEIGSIINQSIEISKPLLDSRRHLVRFEPTPAPIHVDGDFVRLAQVFSNLLNNAARYSAEGGLIVVEVRRENEFAAVAVRDNGIGIPREMLSSIFDMFAQVENPLRKEHDGLGIGLSLVRTIVAMHGGRVEAKSNGIGHGSEFIVSLPVTHGTAVDKRLPSKLPRDVAPWHACRILVVDDNRDAADSLSMMLQLLGFDVQTKYAGDSALELIKVWQPSVVLMDLGMPKMDGYEAAIKIRKADGGSQILLVALTGWGQAEDRQRTEDAGFDHHLVKPVDMCALQVLLERFSAKRSTATNERRLPAAPI